MVTLKSLIKEAKEKTEQANKLRLEIIKEKEKDEQNEASLWIHTPFKEKGLTNDKMRNAYVKQQMGLMYPSFYATKKAELTNIEADLKWIYNLIDIMYYYDVDEIDLEEQDKKEEEKDSE